MHAPLRALLPFLALAGAQAQFSGLSATTDGSTVYFASSLRQRDTQQYLWSKIFRLDSSGAALIAERAQTSPVPPTNDYWLDQPQVSGDGTLVLYRGTLNCGCCSSCFLSEQHTATLLNLTTGQQNYVGANARFSRSGRFLATYSSGNVFNPVFRLIDRLDGATVYQGSFSPLAVSIAANGATVVVIDNSLQLLNGGKLEAIAGVDVAAASISDDATEMIYEAAGRRLFVLNLNSNQTQQLGPDDRDSYQATLSADGQWVAYLSTIGATPQVFFSRVDGSDWKQLTTHSDGVVEVTLSGDATTVFATTSGGSLLRIDTATGQSTALVGPTPVITDLGATTPGSLAEAQGTGLNTATIVVAGLAAPILSRSSNAIVFQVPWEAPLNANAVSIPEGGNPYFDDATPLSLQPFLPEPVPLANTNDADGGPPIAIHTDFRSLVTDDHPASPGEIVHIYLTGGGPVTVPVATGIPSPAQPLSRITTSTSVVTDTQVPLDVTFFGLAPGLVGVWQMDVAMPSTWSRSTVSIQIEFNSPPPNSFGESITLPAIPIM